MGVDLRLVSAAASVLPTELRVLTENEILAWNVDNVRRRFSPVTLRSFGAAGAYAETSNVRSTTASILRIFFRKSVNEPLFVFITYLPIQTEAIASGQSNVEPARERIKSLLSKMNLAINLDQGKPIVTALQVQEIQGALHGNSSVRVFAVVRATNLARQDADRLSRVALQDNGDLSRSEWTFQDIVKFRIEGDRKLLRLAMNNCTD